jgi:hypothetical protein
MRIARHEATAAAGARRRDGGARLVVVGAVFAAFGLVVSARPNLALLAGVLMIVVGSIAVRSGRGLIERAKERARGQLPRS